MTWVDISHKSSEGVENWSHKVFGDDNHATVSLVIYPFCLALVKYNLEMNHTYKGFTLMFPFQQLSNRSNHYLIDLFLHRIHSSCSHLDLYKSGRAPI